MPKAGGRDRCGRRARRDDSISKCRSWFVRMNHEKLRELAKELGRPISTLVALSPTNDPFLITPARETYARWAADIWHGLGIQVGFHKRRIHYRVISQDTPISCPDGRPFENTFNHWSTLCHGLRDAY